MSCGELRALGTAEEIMKQSNTGNFEDAFLFFTEKEEEK